MTREEVEEAIYNIKTKIPDAVIRTQFIVGYPGETEEQFQELLSFVRINRFDRVGCFKYSKEENTKAGDLPDQVDEETKQRRFEELMELQQEISAEKLQESVGKRFQVLVEGYSEETELLLVGRTSQQAPDIDGVTYINDGQAKVGEFVTVEVSEAHDYDFVGPIVESDEPH